MSTYMMLMKSTQATEGWDDYIEKLIQSGHFRGGSAFGNGICVSENACTPCVISGFMRFEAESIDQVKALLPGNPVLAADGAVEIHELIET